MWILYSIIAAALWGLDYSLTEIVLQKISVSTLLCIELFLAFISMLAFSIATGSLPVDLGVVFKSEQTGAFIVIITITFTIANALIALSIVNKSATLAGLIEISYPLFIALFSWRFFGQNGINYGTAVGASCVFIGIALVYFFNR